MPDLIEQLVARAERFAASGAAPVPARLAATVPLLRPGAGGGVEVYLVRRAASMAFAASMYAFPGGVVDPVDHAGAPPGGAADWAVRLGLPAAQARAVVRAALREVTEETGVRLAAADLAPWTRWVTPEFEPRRYDTYFFLAALPAGQDPEDLGGEADEVGWMRPADALAELTAGRIAMLPPTSVTLRELAGYGSVGAALAATAGRDAATPILPRAVRDVDGTPRLVLT
jgi:8-oxo-dGTP pyrophosphatase MutT (NUDIX family)